MAGKKNVTRALISIIFIAYGVSSVIAAVAAMVGLDLAMLLGCALGVLMFTTGICGLFGVQIKICRLLGVFVCLLSVVNFALALAGGSFDVQSMVQALLAWIYFDCT